MIGTSDGQDGTSRSSLVDHQYCLKWDFKCFVVILLLTLRRQLVTFDEI